MAMTRRSWYRIFGIILILGIVAGGGAILWAQYPGGTFTNPGFTTPTSCNASALPDKTIKPLGTWERKVGPLTVTLRFDNDQLHGTINLKRKEGDIKEVFLTFQADYSVTKDYLIYGVVNSLDSKLAGKKKLNFEEITKMEDGLAALEDQPFSMRFRQDGNELILRNLKFHGAEGLDGKTLAIGLGRFTRIGDTTTTIISAKKNVNSQP